MNERASTVACNAGSSQDGRMRKEREVPPGVVATGGGRYGAEIDREARSAVLDVFELNDLPAQQTY